MKLWRSLRFRSPEIPVLAALCTARADGSNPNCLATTKHAILVMVRARVSEAESAIHKLLKSNGWTDSKIQSLKTLDQPFRSDNPTMQDCYKGATSNDGGIVVYSDPILDA